MSQKWDQVRAWDDAFFPRWAWPVKAALRALSSITLAVVVLSGVVLYGVLASVPIGMLAQIPTWLVYIAVFAACVGGATVASVVGAAGLTRSMGRAGRFAVLLGVAAGVAVLAGWLWVRLVWPRLEYHAGVGGTEATGFRLFAEFCERYRSTTLRRLPGVEMTELEFYSAWPMRAMLLLFVVNMVVATVRRIAFTFKNIGVLTVHAGIVLLGLGSVYYSGLKREGDTLLQAGAADEAGRPTPGPAVGFFYDNTRTVLVVDQWRGPEQRLLRGIPRYNDYGVGEAPGDSAWARLGRRHEPAAPDGGTLSVEVERWRGQTVLVDPDIKFRLVGYASYARGQTDWVRADGAGSAAAVIAGRPTPLRLVSLAATLPERASEGPSRVPFFFLPTLPQHRIAETPVFAIEYLGRDAPECPAREAALPTPAAWGLWVRVPGEGSEGRVWSVDPGTRFEVGGYRLEVEEITPEPPFPIVTEGYRGASCAVAQVRVTPPAVEDGEAEPAFVRWVYARFPEINQDMVDASGDTPGGMMPARRDADGSIEIRLIDASKLQVTIREGDDAGGGAGGRVVVRQRGGPVRGADVDDLGRAFEIMPGVTLEVFERWSHAEAFERPVPVPRLEQEREAIGTHQRAMLAVEVTLENRPDFRRVVWLPFTQYLEIGQENARQVELPDGRRIRLMFARRQHRLPGFQLRLVDFQMLSYDHRGAPRDYQSIVAVEPGPGGADDGGFEGFEHITRLNAPLTAPWIWDPQRGAVENMVGRLRAGLDPNQYKFSQAGWDAEGWRESQALADRGMLSRPMARFTILGVGNAPGIHVVALGGILVAVGTPWAFYVKPWLVRRERDRLAARAAARGHGEERVP